MQEWGRTPHRGESRPHKPRPEKGFPGLWARKGSKANAFTGMTTKHPHIQREATPMGSRCQRCGTSPEGLRLMKSHGGSAGHLQMGRLMIWALASQVTM